MTRRTLLISLSCAAAAAESPVYELLERISSALSEGDFAAFIACFDPSLPDYERFQRDARALLVQNNINSSVEVLSASETEAEVDWTLEIRARAIAPYTTSRRKAVRLRWRREGKGNRVTMLEPSDFFAAPPLR